MPDEIDPKKILAPEAKARFLSKIQNQLDGISDLQLSILVWGPGKSHKYFYKRQQIRDELEKMGHYAAFSEDKEVNDLVEDVAKFSLRRAELLQAMSADFIVVLMENEGAISEVSDV